MRGGAASGGESKAAMWAVRGEDSEDGGVAAGLVAKFDYCHRNACPRNPHPRLMHSHISATNFTTLVIV